LSHWQRRWEEQERRQCFPDQPLVTLLHCQKDATQHTRADMHAFKHFTSPAAQENCEHRAADKVKPFLSWRPTPARWLASFQAAQLHCLAARQPPTANYSWQTPTTDCRSEDAHLQGNWKPQRQDGTQGALAAAVARGPSHACIACCTNACTCPAAMRAVQPKAVSPPHAKLKRRVKPSLAGSCSHWGAPPAAGTRGRS